MVEIVVSESEDLRFPVGYSFGCFSDLEDAEEMWAMLSEDLNINEDEVCVEFVIF